VHEDAVRAIQFLRSKAAEWEAIVLIPEDEMFTTQAAAT